MAYVGTVKSYVPSTGWGFIECPETYAQYGKDIFLLQSDLGNTAVQQGDAVTFSVTPGNKGPQASNVAIIRTKAGVPVDGGTTYVGTVKSYVASKGWGFIECAETYAQYGKDIFLMNTDLGGTIVQAGDPISFSVMQGKKGPQATNIGLAAIQTAAAGFKTVASVAGGKTYIGTVKSYVPSKGWGFVDCAETHAQYGKDIFLRQSALGGTIVQAGDPIAFSVTSGTKGPEATKVMVKNTPARVAQTGGPTPRRQVAVGANVGIVKSFNAAKGWGLIASDQVALMYGKDMFFLKTAVPGGSIDVGTVVTFEIGQGRRGPEATSVQAVGAGSPQQQRQAQGVGQGVHGGSAARAAAGQVHEQLLGVIKSYDEEKGWGHIECEEARKTFGKDVFFMRDVLKGSTVSAGDAVVFNCEVTPKGPRAAVCMVLPQGFFNEVYSGVIKSFNEKKGWGFLTSEETAHIFNKDIFVRKHELGEIVPRQGDQFQFTVMVGLGGRLEATNLMPMSGAYAAQRAAAGGGRANPY